MQEKQDHVVLDIVINDFNSEPETRNYTKLRIIKLVVDGTCILQSHSIDTSIFNMIVRNDNYKDKDIIA